MINNKYQALFHPITLPHSGLVLPNRIVMAPMTTYSGNSDGTATDAEVAYYARRSKAAGTIMTACAYVIPHGKGFRGQIGVHSDTMIPSLKRIAEAIKKDGAKAILQIYHGGRMSPPEEVPNGRVLSASNIPATYGNAPIPHPMTEAEIEETIAAFGEATRRAIEAGFDGVEIHGANTYLLQQFFSPHANRREDRWGDSIEKRMAFPLAIVEAVTAAAAKHAKAPFAVGYRLSPEEVEEPGITISDTLQLANALASTKLDYLHISTMSYAGGSMRNSDDTAPRALVIHNHVGHRIPVIGVGSIHNPEEVTTVLNAGIPLVALGRELLMEPDWLTKVKEGKEHDIRTTLSKQAQAELVIPDPMWQGLITRKGWLPVVE